MRAIKTVKQSYSPSSEVLELLEFFRCMINDCVRIGLEFNLTSLKSLSLKCYHQLDKYPIYVQYRLTAISAATGILRNYRKALRKNKNVCEPYVRKTALVTCYGLKIQDGKLRLPIRAREYVFIALNCHVFDTLGSFNVRSVTLTGSSLCIAYEKEVAMIEPVGCMGLDRNLNNVTTATTNLQTAQYDLSKATEIKSKYREVKRHFKRNDHRIRKQVFGRYGQKQRNKVQQILHHASKTIVEEAKQNQHIIVMEKLSGIRKLYRKGNGQGRNYRSIMNSWSYFELQRQIEYKANWEGVRVIYVSPWGSSSRCAKCGCRMVTVPEERRMLECSKCGFHVDRDENAALNIAVRGMRFVPVASASEAVVAESGRPVVIRKVDADELTRRLKS